jgi:hypothetical protein
MTITRIPFQTAMRAAAVQLLTDFKADMGIGLQIYPGRPRTIYPPSAFVDSIDEALETVLGNLNDRNPTVSLVVVHGQFDSADTVAQRDAFVDAFIEWVTDRPHQAGGQTLISVTAVADIPSFVPDWIRPEDQRTYYATQITIGGIAQG